MAHYTDWPEYPTDLLDLVDYPTQTDDVDYVQAWLINSLVHEMIAVQKELGTLPKGASADVKTRLDALGEGYTDRGDPSAYDFVVGDLTTDGTWRDLDLSAIVPAGAKAINLHVWIKDNLINSSLVVRKKGYTNWPNKLGGKTQTANQDFYINGTVACDTDRKISYSATNTTWTTISICVMGWWK